MNTKSILVAAVMTSLSTFAFAGCTSTAVACENRNVGNNFYGLILKSNAQVILTQGAEPSVRIEGDAKSVSSVETSVENGALVINGNNETPVTIYITLDDISLIEVFGSGKIFGSEIINSDMLLLKVVGSGSINVDVRSLSLGMIVKGNGKIYVKGSTGDSFTKVFGKGKVIAVNLDSFKESSEVENGKTQLKSNTNESKHSGLKLQR